MGSRHTEQPVELDASVFQLGSKSARSIGSVDMVPAEGGCQLLNARCAGGAFSGAVQPTGQAHHRVRLPEQIKPIDKDRRRSGEPQRLGLGVGVNPSEPNIDSGATDGIEGMPQPLPGDRQAGAALDEPDFYVHPSILRLLAAWRRDSGLCLVVGPLGATADDHDDRAVAQAEVGAGAPYQRVGVMVDR